MSDSSNSVIDVIGPEVSDAFREAFGRAGVNLSAAAVDGVRGPDHGRTHDGYLETPWLQLGLTLLR